MHRERDRASSFGSVAERYDRSRPTYPAAMVDDLLADGGRRVLDVGCGTGKAGRLFTERGCSVLGVEPDERMAAVARGHGLTVEEGTFEAWEPAGRSFDLVVCGQAWHWVDPRVGVPKAADVLDDGGRFAIFFNRTVHQPDTAAALREVYRVHAPEIVKNSVALGTLDLSGAGSDIAAIDASGRFEPAELRRYERDERHTAEEWVDQCGTHSDHILLSDDQRAALLDAVAAAVPDGLTVTYVTTCVTARRR